MKEIDSTWNVIVFLEGEKIRILRLQSHFTIIRVTAHNGLSGCQFQILSDTVLIKNFSTFYSFRNSGTIPYILPHAT